MKKEDKQLLLVDLCTRLAFHCRVFYEYVDDLDNKTYGYSLTLNTWCIDEFNANKAIVKPYLRPLSSITDDELVELRKICPHAVFNSAGAAIGSWILGINGSDYGRITYIDEMSKILKFCYSHHLDCNGLIEAGLAVEVTEENNPYK